MHKPLTLVSCFPVDQDARQRIGDRLGRQIRWIESDQERIGEDILEADIFLGHAKTPVDWSAVVAAGRLKWIQSTAAGLDHCLVPEVVDSNIRVSGCSGLFADQVAEQAMALLFGLARDIPRAVAQQQSQTYQRYPTREVSGRRVGILGFGGNGQRIADAVGWFTSQIMATDLFHDDVRHPHVTVVSPEQTIAVAEQSDLLIVTLPLLPATRGLVADDVFQAMPNEAIFINVGRGAVVETNSLVRAVTQGQIGGAGIDVVDPEPLPIDHPLWTTANVLITPHVGAQSRHRISRTVDLFLSNWDRFMSGQTLVNEVDKQIGLPRPENRWAPSKNVR